MCDWDKLRQRKHNEFRACALLVPNVRLALVWSSSDAHTFGHAENVRRGWRTQKWMTFIRRSRQIINEFWRTPSESQRTDQNTFFRAWRAWWYVWLGLYMPTSISLIKYAQQTVSLYWNSAFLKSAFRWLFSKKVRNYLLFKYYFILGVSNIWLWFLAWNYFK